MATKRVLFIDDETFFAGNYIDALQEHGFEVVYQETADCGLACLREKIAEVDLLILDIMMPTPAGVGAAATNDGLETGVWLLTEARELIEDRQLPVVVLTNRARKAIEETLRDRVPLPNGLVRVLSKTEVSARQLPPRLEPWVR